MPASQSSIRNPSAVATVAAAVALATAALAAVGVVGLLSDGLARTVAIGTLEGAVGGTILAGTLAAIGLLATRDGDPVGRRRAWLAAGVSLVLLVALLVGLGRGFVPLNVGNAGGEQVFDVATGAPALPDATLERMRRAHPELVPIAVDATVAETFRRVEQAVGDLGWEVVSRDPSAHRLEAHGGAADVDLIVRVRAAEGGALVEAWPREAGAIEPSVARLRALADRLTTSPAAE